jgi:hypothetical protein
MTREAEDDWDEMGAAFRKGAILQATRQDLERYLFALASLQVKSDENRQRAAQMGETIRLLLARKDSQESHQEALGVAHAALRVAAASLAISVLYPLAQAVAAFLTG